MSIIDYSIPQLELLIGTFDCTAYLDSFAINLPMQEINQRLNWSGSFTVSYNLKARANGLSEADFDQNQAPGRWRPDQKLVRMNIRGYPLPALRIERYHYNPQTGIGQGSFYQSLDAVASPRPATLGEIQINYTPVGQIADTLLQNAYRGSSIGGAGNAGAACSGQLLGGITTRDPVNECQQLVGKFWHTLTVGVAEVANAVSCYPSGAPLFTRTLDQIEYEPDINHINFAANRVIVTGSRQVEKIIEQIPGTPRPKLQQTTEKQPFNKVFENAPGQQNNLNPTTSEKKSIGYLYPDDSSIPFYLAALVPTAVLSLIQFQRPIIGADNDTAYLTITAQEWPAGRIFPTLGTNTSLKLAILEIQSETRRIRYVPSGVLTGTGQSFTMVIEKDEKLTTAPVSPRSNTTPQIDPRTGQQLLLEPKPIVEGRKPLQDIPLETIPVVGVASVSNAGWSPAQLRDLIIEVGFLPSEQVANSLAAAIATREARRRDSATVTMPIPIEWLAAGCPILPTVRLWDGLWLAEGLIITMDSKSQEAKFAFTGARMSRQVAPGAPFVPTSTPIAPYKIRIKPIMRISKKLPVELPDNTALPLRIRPIINIVVSNGGGGGVS
jgi:hypothetical protein